MNGLAEIRAEIGNFAAGLEEFKDRINARQDEADRRTNRLESGLLAGGGGSGRNGAPVYGAGDPFYEKIRAAGTSYSSAFNAYLRLHNDGLPGDIRNTLSVGAGEQGGYGVPPELAGEILKRAYAETAMRQICSVRTTRSDALELLCSTSEAQGGWVGETQSRDVTDGPGFHNKRIAVREVFCQPKVTQKLVDDFAPQDFEEYLVNEIGGSLGRLEDQAFIVGDHPTKPVGLLSYASSATTESDSARAWGVVQYRATGQSAGIPLISGAVMASDVSCLYDLVYSLKVQHRRNAKWLMCSTTAGYMRKMRDENGRPYWADSLIQGQPDRLLGYEVAISESMPEIAAGSFSVVFGDFSRGYTIVDRIGLRMLRDAVTEKPFIKFYTTRRVGGDLTDSESLKFLKFGVS